MFDPFEILAPPEFSRKYVVVVFHSFKTATTTLLIWRGKLSAYFIGCCLHPFSNKRLNSEASK